MRRDASLNEHMLMRRNSTAQYGVILDAGSSGTRVYVYKWKNPNRAAKKHPNDLEKLPKLKLEKSKKIHPGVSTFAEKAETVGEDHLKELIQTALDEVPDSKVAETPVFLMATAGVRLLPKPQQRTLLQEVCGYLQSNTKFILPDCDAHVQVISGQTEGLYGWIAANYLLGGFDHPERHGHVDSHHTYGFLDMGGASAQIAFAPNSTEAEKHADDLKLVRMRHLDGEPVEYKVFTSTWLGFGANQARERYIERLLKEHDDKAAEIPDPCLPKGLRVNSKGDPIEGGSASKGQALVGTGVFEECMKRTYPLLEKDKPCPDAPCLLNGQHAPAIDFKINHFVGVSEYWHTTHGVFGKDKSAFDFTAYQKTVKEFCGKDWSSIEDGLTKRKKSQEAKLTDAREACFKASWLINMLYSGIGVPRVGIEHTPPSGIDTNKDAIEDAKENGFLDPFQPVDKVDGIEVSWTLGKMVLYAAGQIQPRGSDSPVGFGSNIGSGTPKDFELAGSTPLLPGREDDDDDDDDDSILKPSHSTSGLFFFIILLIVIGYLLRKPDRRRRIMSSIRGYRKPGNGKRYRSLSFMDRIFGRNAPSYDRVMEEGDAPEFELGDMESEDNEQSDSSESSRHGQVAPRFNIDRADDMKPPSAIDRAGMVVRTESCERLGPSPQMLNAGRRSRAGSPTRKSPLMTPIQS